MEEARDNLEVRHSVAPISSSATRGSNDQLTGDETPPFGSTDIIECNVRWERLWKGGKDPPFGSTDIIECNGESPVYLAVFTNPPFGSTDIIECNPYSAPSAPASYSAIR